MKLMEDDVCLSLIACFYGRVVAVPQLLLRSHGRRFRKWRLKALLAPSLRFRIEPQKTLELGKIANEFESSTSIYNVDKRCQRA